MRQPSCIFRSRILLSNNRAISLTCVTSGARMTLASTVVGGIGAVDKVWIPTDGLLQAPTPRAVAAQTMKQYSVPGISPWMIAIRLPCLSVISPTLDIVHDPAVQQHFSLTRQSHQPASSTNKRKASQTQTQTLVVADLCDAESEDWQAAVICRR